MGANASRHHTDGLPNQGRHKLHVRVKHQRPKQARLAACLSFRSSKVHAVSHASSQPNSPGSPTKPLPFLLSFKRWSFHAHSGLVDPADTEQLQVDVSVQVEDLDLLETAPPRAGSKEFKWKKGDRIGFGSFGSVYFGLNCATGELMAVKEVATCMRETPHQKEALEQLEQELAVLSTLQHRNIVRYQGTAREGASLYIFMEYMPGGSISSLVNKFGPLDEPVIQSYTRQLLSGLTYLHAQRVIHRDIKGANLLVEKDGTCKLSDFGMAKQMVEEASVTQSFKGSAFWMAPEVIRQQGHGAAADIWSVGCTVLEMATGKPPWSPQCTTQVQAIFKIASSNEVPAIPDTLTAAAADFIQLCLQRDPATRPSAQQLLRHPFVAGVDVYMPAEPPLQLQRPCSTCAKSAEAPLDSDAASQALGRARGSRSAAGKLDQQQPRPWVNGRNSSPKRVRPLVAPAAAAALAGGRPGAAWVGVDKTAGGIGKAAPGALTQSGVKRQSSRSAVLAQPQVTNGNAAGTGAVAATVAAVTAASADVAISTAAGAAVAGT